MRYTVLIKQLDANTFGHEGSLKHKRMKHELKTLYVMKYGFGP